MQILVPKRSINIPQFYGDGLIRPIIFFAGPVRGGGDWQVPMAHLVKEHPKLTKSIVAIPCRWDATHKMAPCFISGDQNVFPRQLNWERKYLKIAGLAPPPVPGCVLFWLGEEDTASPHPGPEPYSMDTRGEVAEWRMRMAFQNARVVIGAEPGYHGLSQIQRNYSQELGYDFPIYQTKEATVNAAAEMAFRDL